MLTSERLRELLSYNAETGVFTWKKTFCARARAGQVAGNKHSLGYIRVRIDGIDQYCHRLAWLYVYGSFPDGILDHKDQNKANNQIANLRLASLSENQQNRYKQKNNCSGFRGVYWNKSRKKWDAQIQVNGVKKHIGRFETPDAAYAAYCFAAAHMHTKNPAASDIR